MDILQVRSTPSSPWTAVPALVGPKGDKGDTPVKGVDYFTTAELQALPYDNMRSGLISTTLQNAIDEMAATRLADALVAEETLPTAERAINWIYA